jgi:4-amino-4-deoxy-L-arabinose transferase-like glycosyltransferase
MNTESLQGNGNQREPDDNNKYKRLLSRIGGDIFQFVITHRLIIIILFVSFFLRLSLYTGISPNYFGDSDGYDRGAVNLLQGNSIWSSHPRTPAYPAYLAMVYKAAGIKNWKAVVMSQLFILGLARVWMMYVLGMRLTGNKIIAALAAVLYNLDFMIIEFDFAILTESLSGFLLLLSILLLIKAVEERKLKWTIPSGVVMGITALVRPAFVPLFAPVFLFFIIGLAMNAKPKIFWKPIVLHSAIYILLSITPCFVWLKGNHARGNSFSFSPFMMNAGLTNHVGFYFEKLPDEYAPVRDPYVRLRNERRTTVGGYYRAREKMFTGARQLGVRTEKEFEEFMTKLCLGLIRDHPKSYMKTFLLAWDMMWANRPLIYFQPPESKDSTDNFPRVQKKIFWGFWLRNIEGGILQKKWFNGFQFKLFFLGAVLCIILLWREKSRVLVAILLFAVILTLSITTNALELSENARYRAPFQSLVILICFSGAGIVFAKIAHLIRHRIPRDTIEQRRKKSGKRKKGKV